MSVDPKFGKMMRRFLIPALTGALLIACGAIDVSMSDANAASDPAKVFSNSRTAALAKAVADNNSVKVRELVQHGANLADHGEADVTLLQWAMIRGRPAMVELLVELGADPSEHGYGGQTALHTAAMAKKTPYLKFFLDHGADPNLRGGPPTHRCSRRR